MSAKDHGPAPYVVDIEALTTANDTYRTAGWTGAHLQLTLMSIPVGESIGLEVHEDTDQFLRLEAGKARVQMGPAKTDLAFDEEVEADWAIFVPAQSWHNVTNIGDEPLKIYSIYAPSHHPHGTVQQTKADAEAAEAAEAAGGH
jgi:mannose-6-phosphate isomerase-like protein (cupin superfamily)